MMSRHGYSDDLDQWALIKWRGRVASAIRGQRGQKLLVDLVKALDAMPEKTLIAGNLINNEGDICALGAVGVRRGVPLNNLDPEDPESVAEAFNIAVPLAREISYVNDEGGHLWHGEETPQARWQRVRTWALSQIRAVPVVEAKEDDD
jgi:hypothetical protein